MADKWFEELTFLRRGVTSFPDRPLKSTLESFGNKYPTRDYIIEFDCPEFTSLCPVTAQPAPDPALAERQRARLEEMRQRGGTTAYPRLSLAAGQRVASKGAYLGRLNPGDPGFAERPELFQP